MRANPRSGVGPVVCMLAGCLLSCWPSQTEAFGQLTRFDDPEVFSSRVVVIDFGEFRSDFSPAGNAYQGAGARFTGQGGSLPVTFPLALSQSINPPIDVALRNQPDGDSGGRSMIVQLTRPALRVGVRLGNGSPETTARLEAYTAAGKRLGSVEIVGVDPVGGPLIGLQTDDPEGISTLTIDYGEDPAAEQLNDFYYEPLSDLPFRVCLPQIAHARVGDKLLRTVFQIHVSRTERASRLRLYDDAGDPLSLTLSGQTASDFELSPGLGRSPRLFELVSEGSGDTPRSGYACVESDFPVAANALYQVAESAGGELISEAGVLGEQEGVLFFIPMQQRPALGLDSGVALVNLSDQESLVDLLLFTPEGIGRPPEVRNNPLLTLAPGEHRAFFLSQLCGLESAFCPGGPDGLKGIDFLGTLMLVSDHPVAVTALRTVFGLPVSSLAAGSFQR